MQQHVRRRKFLGQIAAGAAVTAFDAFGRSWVTAIAAGSGVRRIPKLDGKLLLDGSDASRDFGLLIARSPVAVLLPGSVRDVATIVKYANDIGVKVAARGQGYSTYGQAMVEGGVIIDSRSLNHIHDIAPGHALVDAGIRWDELVRATLKEGRVPPVIPDNMNASVGGALSMGDGGGSSVRHGVIGDNVFELDVITGLGDLVTCSRDLRPDLFAAVLGGLGQFGIILRAKLRLERAPEMAQVYVHFYDEVEGFLADQVAFARDKTFDHLGGVVQSVPGGGVKYALEAAAYHPSTVTPNDVAKRVGVKGRAFGFEAFSVSFWEWAFRMTSNMAHYEQAAAGETTRPWLYLYVPEASAERFIRGALGRQELLDPATGAIRVYAMSREHFTLAFAVTPAADVFFAIEVLSSVAPAQVASRLGGNRKLYELARDVGGKRHPAGSLQFTAGDWREHFGGLYPMFVERKRLFDPRNVLTPGHGMFPLGSACA
jgi:cytokinin dehydrogenase